MTTVESLAEYITLIEAKCNHDDYFFRGQREDWELLPKLARLVKRKGIIEDEKLMLQEFRRHLVSFNLSPSNDWELLSIAQHHGMATRLLDWTSSPLVALWFAIREPAESDENAVVYIFDCDPEIHLLKDIDNTKPNDKGFTEFFVPNILSARIRVQQGYFSVHKYNSKNKRWVPLQNNSHFKSRLTKIEIKPKYFSNIRYSLDQCGINESTLFPDLDGLCKYITWRNSKLKDEHAV